MGIMRRDVNVGLLLLIVAALLMFSGFTVYYQTSFKNVSRSYETKLQELEKVSNELESKKGQLNETSIQLQLRKQKEEDLSQKFTDVRGEKEQLESDKAKLQSELSSTKTQLAATSAELSTTKSQLAAQVQLTQQLNTQVLNLKSDVDKYKPYKAKYECVANKVDSSGNAC